MFLDTNVIASGLSFPSGPPEKIIDLHERGEIRVVLSQQVLDELARTITRKLPSATGRLAEFLLNERFELVMSASDISGPTVQLNDRDQPIVRSAIEADVDFFVTGDLKLLNEITAAGISRPPCMTPAQFVASVEAPS